MVEIETPARTLISFQDAGLEHELQQEATITQYAPNESTLYSLTK